MSLTNRLSLFFLFALSLVLVGFSLTLYALAWRHLHLQVDRRLDAAMETLVAAIEVHAGDVQWEPLERRIALGEGPALDQVRWTLHTLGGKLVDYSQNYNSHETQEAGLSSESWRILVRQVKAGQFEAQPLPGRDRMFRGALDRAFPEGESPRTAPLSDNRTNTSDGFVLTVAVSELPMQTTLYQLALAMGGVSLVIWLAAIIGCRWLCRQALRPITRMSSSARSLRQHPENGEFLDVAPTGDELEDLGRAFNDLLASLRETLDRQRRFAGDASHQLRTPLTALLGQVEVALRQERGAKEYRRVLEVVQRRGMQLRQIIESLLFLARADSAAQQPEYKVVSLVEWCETWLSSWSDHPRAADFHCDWPENTILHVRTNPAMLGQVFDNLLDNACKYSEAGSPITIAIKVNSEEAIMTVADEGWGIASEEIPQVCDPFFRSGQARTRGKTGTGLGLTVVQRIVAVLGGRLEVESELGNGSRFRVILPIVSVAENELCLMTESE